MSLVGVRGKENWLLQPTKREMSLTEEKGRTPSKQSRAVELLIL